MTTLPEFNMSHLQIQGSVSLAGSTEKVSSVKHKPLGLVRREVTFAGKSKKREEKSTTQSDNFDHLARLLHRSRTLDEIRSGGFGFGCTCKSPPPSMPSLYDSRGRYIKPCPHGRHPPSKSPTFLQPLDTSCLRWRDGYLPRVGSGLNRKIVSRLRTNLNIRHEKRVQQLIAGELNLDGSSDGDTSPSRGRSQAGPTPHDVFSSYTDNGDVIRRKKTKPGTLPRLELPATAAGQHPVDAEPTNGDSNCNRKLPNGTDEQPGGLILPEVSAGQLLPEQSGGRPLLPEQSGGLLVPVAEECMLDVVSPVPTPRLTRPETRFTARLSYEEKVSRILRGKMDCRVTAPSKIIRMFIHSAGPDTEIERSTLIKSAYPELKEYAILRGYELQLVDLLWGVHDHVTDSQSDVEFSLRLLSKCKERPEALNFITFLSQKSAEPALPAQIPASEYEAIVSRMEEDQEQKMAAIRERLAAIEAAKEEKEANDQNGETTDVTEVGNTSSKMSTLRHTVTILGKETKVMKAMKAEIGSPDEPEPQLLRNWYQLDENAIPSVYRLDKVSTHNKDILSNDVTRRAQAHSTWVDTATRMQKMLYHYAQQVLEDPSSMKKYNQSLCELELESGVFDAYEDTSQTVAWFQRHMTDADEEDPSAADYIDSKNTGMGKACHSQLQEMLSPSRHRQYSIQWQIRGVNPTNREHALYLERLCNDVTDVVKHAVDQFAQGEVKATADDTLFNEVNLHVEACRSRCRVFHGRKDLLQRIKGYVRSHSCQPLIVYGKSGCGKTSVVAKAGKDAHKWFKRVEPATLVRMIGVSASSTNVRMLLRSLCLQMCQVFGTGDDDIPNDYRSLVNVFAYKLTQATQQTPLIIFLESLHQLTDENDGRKMVWLPRELPPHVKIVVSTLEEEKYDCFKHLKKAFPGERPNFVEVGPVPPEDTIAILEHWYDQTDRKITHQQFDVIVDAMEKCAQPLYLRVLFNESLHWASALKAEDIKVGATVGTIAVVVFGRLERSFGEPLVRRALGYLTAAKNGVTGNEMDDLLSLDEAVMDDIFKYTSPILRRVPCMYWMRLRDEMGEYLEETESDNTVTLQWAHIQFREAAVERYLNQRDKAPSYHKALGDYFRDKWGGAAKPYGSNEKGVDRYVMAQPMLRKGSDREVYNLRRLSELPHHLLRSQQMDVLKRECLCNFEFLLAKITATSLRALFEDIQSALIEEPGDQDLKVMSDTLHLSANALSQDARQLGSQIVGRLFDLVTKDVPMAPGDPPKYPYMKPLLAQAQRSSTPALIPSVTCLSPPGGILFDLLSGHAEPITAVSMTTDGQRAVTSSEDNTLKIWELRTGRVTKTLNGVGENVIGLCVGANNTQIITSEVDCIRVWSIRTGDCVQRVDQYEDPATLTTANDSMLLVAFFHGSNMMRVWRLDKAFEMLQEVALGVDHIHKDNSIIVSLYSTGPLVLHAFRGSSNAVVRNASTGQVVQTLRCKDAASVTALAGNRDYFICAARYPYMKLHEMYHLELFDVRNGKHVRSVRGCASDNIQQLFVNQLGSHALALCASEATNVTDIAAWNIETEDHKHLARHAKVSHFGACVDLRYVLTAAKGDKTLRIWNLSGKVNQPVQKQKAQAGTEKIIPMIDNLRYVVAKAVNNGPLAVWNVAKGKCSGNAVRIERGLLDPSDILLVRNTRVIILTDKNFPTAGQRSRPVFQRVHIYDLRQKKYLHRISGCFIVPSPAHEYALLDDNHLLGLSDNRTHFIVWSLVSGQIVYRLKTAFRQLQKKLSKESRGTSLGHSHGHGGFTPRFVESRAKLHDEKTQSDELKNEKDNAIEQYMISEDYATIVASFYSHHLCVFDIESRLHTHTLENPNSMLLLHVAALTPSGGHLVHTNYDDVTKTSYVTLWDCGAGFVKKRLRNERNVCAVAVSKNADCVVYGKTNKELRIWQLGRRTHVRRMHSYQGLEFGAGSQIHIVEEDWRVVVFAGGISVWDMHSGSLLAVFTPDVKITTLNVAMNGMLVVFGTRENSQLVTLKLMSSEVGAIKSHGQDMFGEVSSSSEDEEEEEEDEEGP